jgi:hypothetical protein
MINRALDPFSIPARVRQTAPPLNVMIAYQDLSAGKRAMDALEAPASQLGGAFQVRPVLWRFDFLEDPNWRALATADVFGADMLVVSVSCGNDLPSWLQKWICAALSQRRDRAGALVVLLGTEEKAPTDGRLLQVQEAAREAGWDFFSALVVNNASENGWGQARIPACHFGVDQGDHHRHWGINE